MLALIAWPYNKRRYLGKVNPSNAYDLQKKNVQRYSKGAKIVVQGELRLRSLEIGNWKLQSQL